MPYQPTPQRKVAYHSAAWCNLVEQGWVTAYVDTDTGIAYMQPASRKPH